MVYVTQLIYINPGKEPAFEAFEEVAIPLTAKYGGEVLLRVRPDPASIVAAAMEIPYEIHFVRFDSEEGLRRFTEDPERQKVLHLKDESVRAAILVTGAAR